MGPAAPVWRRLSGIQRHRSRASGDGYTSVAAAVRQRHGNEVRLSMSSKEAKNRTLHIAALQEHANGHVPAAARTGSPILVVEDDPPIRESLAEVLRDEGYTVMEASDGVEALRLLARSRERFVIFLDLLMPRMDGVEVCERIMADPALRHDHAVILMSAWFNHTAPTATNELARLYKPFDIAIVLELASRFSKPPER